MGCQSKKLDKIDRQTAKVRRFGKLIDRCYPKGWRSKIGPLEMEHRLRDLRTRGFYR